MVGLWVVLTVFVAQYTVHVFGMMGVWCCQVCGEVVTYSMHCVHREQGHGVGQVEVAHQGGQGGQES